MNNPRCRAFLVAGLIVFGCGSLAAQEPPEVWVDDIRAPQYFALYVEDVDKSVRWYRAVFGLRQLGGSAAEDGSWRIENLGSQQLLVELIRDDRAQSVDRALGFRKIGFFVRDIEQIAERIMRANGERPRIVDFAQLEQRILQMRDPDGNIIQLISSLENQE